MQFFHQQQSFLTGKNKVAKLYRFFYLSVGVVEKREKFWDAGTVELAFEQPGTDHEHRGNKRIHVCC